MVEITVRRPEFLLDPGESSHCRMLPRAPESAAVARRLARAVLEAWCLSALAEDVALVLTELVANAAEHAIGTGGGDTSAIRISFDRGEDGRVVVAVTDLDRTVPVLPMPAGTEEEHGRGLALVDAVSARWGVDPLPWGKRVWAELGAA